MPLVRKLRTAVGAGAVVALVLVLVFGSPWYRDWAAGLDAGTPGGWFAQTLAWPAWNVDADDSIRDTVSNLLQAVLVVGFAALFLSLMPVARGGALGRVLTGWAGFVFAAAAAAAVAAVIRTSPSLLATFDRMADGATYGLFAGWIVGLAVLAGRRSGD